MALSGAAPFVRSLPVQTVARATGAHPRTVERWRAGTAAPRRRQFTVRLAELRAVLDALGGLSRAGQASWLSGRSAYLGGERPVDLLAAGEAELVRGAALAYASGDLT